MSVRVTTVRYHIAALDRTAKELLKRLREEQPGAFSDGQLRTLQRRVKE